MKNRIIYVVFCLVFVISFSAITNNIAITLKNGEIIKVKSDFTWEYLLRDGYIVFKDIKFGKTPKDLYAFYSSKKDSIANMESEDVYYFNDSFGGIPAILFFYFKDNKLYKGKALFKINSTSEELYLKNYNKIKDIISDMYGKSISNDDSKTIWDFVKYKIELTLTNKNGFFSMDIIYVEKDEIPLKLTNDVSQTEQKKVEIKVEPKVIKKTGQAEPMNNRLRSEDKDALLLLDEIKGILNSI